MSAEVLKAPEQALEVEFFACVSKEVRDQLREAIARGETKTTLAQITGFGEAITDDLLHLGCSPELVVALGLTPLILVGWADHEIDASERRAIMHVALSQRLPDQVLTSRLVEPWTQHQPSSELFVTWKRYTKAICEVLTTDVRENLQNKTLQHAMDVARASGNLLGYGKVSKAEQAMVDKIELSFVR